MKNNYAVCGSAAVKKRSVIKARVIILIILFVIFASVSIFFLSFYIKAWVLISKMDRFEYRISSEETVTVSVSGMDCKYTLNSILFKQKQQEGELYLKNGDVLETVYFKIEPGRFGLRVDGYDGTFEFYYDPDKGAENE